MIYLESMLTNIRLDRMDAKYLLLYLLSVLLNPLILCGQSFNPDNHGGSIFVRNYNGSGFSESFNLLIGNAEVKSGVNATDIDHERWKSVRFSMGSELHYVTDVVLQLSFDGDPSLHSIPNIYIKEDSNGVPGSTIVGHFQNPGFVGNHSIQFYKFTPIEVISLLPNQTYWLVVTGHNDANSFSWRGAGHSQIYGNGITDLLLMYYYSSNKGNSWELQRQPFNAIEIHTTQVYANLNIPDKQEHFIGNDGGPKSIELPISLDSSGHTAGLQFSINFDSQIFENPLVQLGAGSDQAHLLVNSLDMENGKLGIAIAILNGLTFGSGIQDILSLQLDVKGTARYSETEISISSDLLAIEAVGVGGDSMNLGLSNSNVKLNHIPEASDDSYTTNEDQSIVLDLLSNDSDFDDQILTIQIIQNPMHGLLEINDEGSILYAPFDNFNGIDEIVYVVNDGHIDSLPASVTININSVNDAPVVISGNIGNGFEDQDLPVQSTLVVTDNDGLSREDIFSIPEGHPNVGIADVDSSTGVWTYIPAGNYYGIVIFDIAVKDDSGNTFAVQVEVTITQVDDPAVITGDLSGSMVEDGGNVLGDINAVDDADGLTDLNPFSLWVNAIHGLATVNSQTGGWSYTPDENFHGLDTFTIRVTDDLGHGADQVIEIEVIAVNDPVAVSGDLSGAGVEDGGVVTGTIAAVDSIDGLTDGTYFSISAQPVHGVVEIGAASGLWSYTPVAHFHGSDNFNVVITDDDGHQETIAVDIVIESVDDPVLVSGDINGSGAEDTSITGTIVASDPADGLTDGTYFAVKQGPGHGTAQIEAASGAWTYTPSANFHGDDEFIITIMDDDGYALDVVISVVVTSVDDELLVVSGDSGTLEEDTNLTQQLLVSDADGLTQEDRFIVSATPSHGSASVESNTGQWTYIPEPNYSGSDNFQIRITDDDGFESQVEITITIHPVDDPAQAEADS